MYDLESINTVPITLINGFNDDECTPETATTLAAKLSTLQNFITIGNGDHMTFAESNAADYFNLLLDEVNEKDVGTKTITLAGEKEEETTGGMEKEEVTGGEVTKATDTASTEDSAMTLAPQATIFALLFTATQLFLQ